MNPRIANVEPLENYSLLLTFTNGEKKTYDCTPLLNFGIFSELKDPKYFRKVQVSGKTITWNNKQDICPDTLYLDSKDFPVL